MTTVTGGTWRDAVTTALQELGGRATLKDIYRQIQNSPHTPLTTSWQALVRRTLRQYSSDSEQWLGKENLFTAVRGLRSGEWALRQAAQPTEATDAQTENQSPSSKSRHLIKSFIVLGLNDKFDFDLVFNEDINIFTGRNGTGKTTVLKLIWYLISGNLERIPAEMRFDSLEIETNGFSLSMAMRRRGNADQVSLSWQVGKESSETTLSIDMFQRPGIVEELNQKIATVSGASIFFPTFRRIEGGFSTYRYHSMRQRNMIAAGRLVGRLQEAMSELSSGMSVFDHHFVASISTDDIVELLTGRYAEISERTNSLHRELSNFISTKIGQYTERRRRTDAAQLKSATSILNDIEERVERDAQRRDELLRPFSVLSELVSEVFQYTGIQVTEAITLGDAKGAVASDKLSAGEKQMLSFLCYNAFTPKSMIFIDEPELSLHVDWQRLLFPTLLAQGTANQFIVATHSPFIYSKYPDKELMLDVDRGGR